MQGKQLQVPLLWQYQSSLYWSMLSQNRQIMIIWMVILGHIITGPLFFIGQLNGEKPFRIIHTVSSWGYEFFS